MDTRSGSILAEGTCVLHPVDGTSVAALARTGLKAELRGVAESCIDDYGRRILGL